MKRIRISENTLREMISRSLVNEAAPNKTDRKTNRRVSAGEFKQIETNDDELSEQKVIVPNQLVIVKVNENGESGCYEEISEEFWRFIRGGGRFLTKSVPGLEHYHAMLKGTVNQLYGQPIYADYSKDPSRISRKHGDEPFNPERGVGAVVYSAKGRNSDLCPFEYNEKGFVCVKPGMEEVVDDYLVYGPRDGEEWDYATYDKANDVFKFFFSYEADRINFVRQLNNMFNIARRICQGGKYTNTFITYPTTPVIISQEKGINPLDYLDSDEDSEFIDYVNDLIEQQKSLAAAKNAQNSEEEVVEPYDDMEDIGDTPSMGLASNEQPSVDVEGDEDKINENKKGKKKITESQLRKMIRKAIIESLGH